MTAITCRYRTERFIDASVVTAVVDIAGSRHEVLPPRQSVAAGISTPLTWDAAPP
ncbi:hypothetical protein [Microbacterium jejuense]|uniref:hypothetical protein n=1 Tax=Microbacterium jejuense TaxID=1263637 RepID=UPI0031F1626F